MKADFRASLIIGLTLAQVVFQERLVFHASSGGRGNVPILWFLFPLVGSILLLPARKKIAACFRIPDFYRFWLWTILCTLTLPVLGVFFLGFPVRTLISSWEGVLALTTLATGAWAWHQDQSFPIMERILLSAVWAHALVALLQVAPFLGGVSGSGPIQQFLDWDAQFKATFSSENMVVGRATGLYLNPNALGVWSCFGSWACGIFLRGWPRKLGLAGSILTLILSLSRGSMFALTGSIVLYFLAQFWRNRQRTSNQYINATNLKFAFGVISTSVLCGMVVYTFAKDDQSGLFGTLLSRVSAGMSVVTQGRTADSNFMGRVEVWGNAWDFFQRHPFGTFGSPQFVLGQSLDNEYMRALLQGGVIFLGSFILMLVGGMRLLLFQHPVSRFVGATTLVVAINSISATPLIYPCVGMYWLGVGAFLACRDVARRIAFSEQVN